MRGFIGILENNFLKITKPLTALLEKDAPLNFDHTCVHAFTVLKQKLNNSLILVSPEWSLPFELMCGASDFAKGVVLGHRKGKYFQSIYYTSKTLINTQANYTTMEKELLAFDKFCPYLILLIVIVYTNHSAVKYLISKNMQNLD